jgi:hypothetical protein
MILTLSLGMRPTFLYKTGSTEGAQRTTMRRVRGDHHEPNSMFSYVSPEQRIPKDLPPLL